MVTLVHGLAAGCPSGCDFVTCTSAAVRGDPASDI
jgi:hypothetical protein